MKYKVVDNILGLEYAERFDSKEDAETALKEKFIPAMETYILNTENPKNMDKEFLPVPLQAEWVSGKWQTPPVYLCDGKTTEYRLANKHCAIVYPRVFKTRKEALIALKWEVAPWIENLMIDRTYWNSWGRFPLNEFDVVPEDAVWVFDARKQNFGWYYE